MTPPPTGSVNGFDVNDDETATLALEKFKTHFVSRLDLIQKLRVFHIKKHGHAAPADALDRAMGKLDLAILFIDFLDRAFPPVGLFGSQRQGRTEPEVAIACIY